VNTAVLPAPTVASALMGCGAGASIQTTAAPFRNETTPTRCKAMFGHDVERVRLMLVHFADSHAPGSAIPLARRALGSTQAIAIQHTPRFNTYQFDSCAIGQ